MTMAARKVFDLVATVGTYKASDGTEKKRYAQCGAVFQQDDGRMSCKIETLPVGGEWSGWLSFMEPKQHGQQAPQQQQPAPQYRQASQAAKPMPVFEMPLKTTNESDDKIPF
jgi:hypothetical protein